MKCYFKILTLQSKLSYTAGGDASICKTVWQAGWKAAMPDDLRVTLRMHSEKYMVFVTIKWQIFSIVVPLGKYKI